MEKAVQTAEAESVAAKKKVSQVVQILVGLALLAGIVVFTVRGGNFSPTTVSQIPTAKPPVPSPTDTETMCGPATERPIVVEMVHSEDLEAWVGLAADRFSKLCPNIQVSTQSLQELTVINRILTGTLTPTIWAPADELSLRLMEYRWVEQGGRALFDLRDAQSLVESPLILLSFQDRLRVLSTLIRTSRDGSGQWVRGLCPMIPRIPDLRGVPMEAMVPGQWADLATPIVSPPPIAKPRYRRGQHGAVRTEDSAPRLAANDELPALEILRSWGAVKIGRPRPTRYAAGAAVLFLMANDYARWPSEALLPPPAGEPGAELPDDKASEAAPPSRALESAWAEVSSDFPKWLGRCEAGLDPPLLSEIELPSSMANLGPRMWDGVITYEQQAMPFLARSDAHAESMPKLVVAYPRPTLIARHPAVIVSASAAQKDAAQRWLRFLRSKPMQHQAIALGFRPSNPEVSLQDLAVEQNSFLRMRRYGIVPTLHVEEPPRPSGAMIHKLITLWGDATGRK